MHAIVSVKLILDSVTVVSYMTELQISNSRVNRNRFIASTIAGALLNVGLYFLLYIFTPLVTGIVVGFLLRKYREGSIAAFIGSFLTFLSMLLYSLPALIDQMISSGQATLDEIMANLPWLYVQIGFSALLLSILGLAGGLIGAYIGRHALSQS